MENEETIVLTKAQKARIDKNRQKALILRNTKLVPHPYAKGQTIAVQKNTIKIGQTNYKDTGGGFLIEEIQKGDEVVKIVEEHPPLLEPDWPKCEDCEQIFTMSYLFNTFDYKVCDSCRLFKNNVLISKLQLSSGQHKLDEEKHNLITKTEAMKEYLLKDCDLDKREPILKFITRKNPHNSNWGNMKLYLQIQIEKKALEIWGSEENLREEMEKREEKKVITKTKKYHKEIKKLRMTVRSSLYDKTASASHKHAFGTETYNEEDDDYTRICTTCGFKETFEKM